MDPLQLRTPILAGGIRSVNFFNGRMLSAEDLSQEKIANKEARQQLGQAIGDGIAYGLEVRETLGVSSTTAPVVTVTEGLALNRLGQALQLRTSVEVALARPPQSGGETVNALFYDCRPPQAGPYVTGKGVYVLTIQSAAGVEGKAPVSGLGNLDAACNARYQIDGVQFRLIQLPVTSTELSKPDLLRNHMAYRCFGVNDNAVASFPANPFGPPVTSYGLMDDLRPNCLQDDEVPLALIFWTVTGGIGFVDMWSVRRRITKPSTDQDWALLTSARRIAEGEAMFLQFQQHIQDIRLNQGTLETMVATDRFEYLPPVGLLPVGGVRSSRGFDYKSFFRNKTFREPTHVESARVNELFHEALLYPPIELSSPEMLWLYYVQQNRQTIFTTSSIPPQGYLIFVNGHMSNRGEARFDLNHWDYGNFA